MSSGLHFQVFSCNFRGSAFSGLCFWVLGLQSSFSGVFIFATTVAICAAAGNQMVYACSLLVTFAAFEFVTNMPNSLPLLIHCFDFSFYHKPQAISVIYTPKFSINSITVKRWNFWKLIIFTKTSFHLLLFDWWPVIQPPGHLASRRS